MSTVFERAKAALRVKTNKELAEKLNQAESSVSGWKSRDNIPIDYLLVISKLSGVSVDWILKGSNDSIFPPAAAIPKPYLKDDEFDAIFEPSISQNIDSVLNNGAWEQLAASDNPDLQDQACVYAILARLKKALDIEDVDTLSGFINVPVKTINRWINHGYIPYRYLIFLADKTSISLDWLILGKGEAPKTHSELAKEVWLEIGHRKLVSDDENKPYGVENQTITSNIDNEKIQLVSLYDVPVSAGHGSFFDTENIIQQIPFDSEWLEREELIAGQLACLPIKGDSMSPGLKTSDIVLINLTHQRGDGVFVLRLNGALRIKRLQWLADGRLRISSDNPIYETEYVDPNTPPDDFAIIGFCHTKIGRVD
ncbi:MAG: helix-turn-helix domain-containing protein [Eikenella corrodens]|uniref:Repressor protein CI n=1 Tax=Myoviridae sp. ctiv53 TaxID=2827703 RepID=A0A8S5TIG5_9CAUD|nr:MAG TPA: Repressor protein CI [Myoviridae sp. ctiv53]